MLERGSNLEIEYKFYTEDTLNIVLLSARSIIEPSWSLIKNQNRVIHDIYFDTDDMLLYRMGVRFRLRKCKKKKEWISCYKYIQNNRNDFLERKKIRTNITNNEALLYNNNTIPGNAAKELYKFFKDHTSSKDIRLKPFLFITQFRDRYSIRPVHYRNYKSVKLKSYNRKEHTNLMDNEMVNIIYDDFCIYNISKISTDDFQYLVYFCELDLSNQDYDCKHFKTGEIEASHYEDAELNDKANDIFIRLIDKLNNLNLKRLFKDKYQIGIENFNLAHIGIDK